MGLSPHLVFWGTWVWVHNLVFVGYGFDSTTFFFGGCGFESTFLGGCGFESISFLGGDFFKILFCLGGGGFTLIS